MTLDSLCEHYEKLGGAEICPACDKPIMRGEPSVLACEAAGIGGSPVGAGERSGAELATCLPDTGECAIAENTVHGEGQCQLLDLRGEQTQVTTEPKDEVLQLVGRRGRNGRRDTGLQQAMGQGAHRRDVQRRRLGVHFAASSARRSAAAAVSPCC